MDVNDAMQTISEAVGEEAEIFLGAVTDPSLGDRICVTVIATGIEAGERRADEPLQLPARSLAAPAPEVRAERPAPRPEPLRLEPREAVRPPARPEPPAETLRLERPQPLERPPFQERPAPRPEPRRSENLTKGGVPLLINWDSAEAERVAVQARPLAASPLPDEEPAGGRQVSFRPSAKDGADNLDLPTFLRRTMD